MRVPTIPQTLSRSAFWLCAAVLSFGFSPVGHAGLTDISQTPLITAGGAPVKPNLLFILDDSGSMASNYLPEEADMGNQTYSLNAAQCNGLGFDPSQPYPVPVNADGTSKGNHSISAAFDADSWLEVTDANNYDSRRPLQGSNLVNSAVGATVTVKINLSSRSSSWYWVDQLVTIYDNSNKQKWMIGMVSASYSSSGNSLSIKIVANSGSHTLSTPYVGTGHPHFVYYTYPNTNTRLGYSYLSTGKVDTSKSFYKECNSVVGKTPGSSVFTRQIMRPTDAKAQDFANWYRYYSNRMDMMKTVVSQAFKEIDDKFRVGYTTILSKTVAEQVATSTSSINAYTKWGPEATDKMFVNVRDFDSAQRNQFYAYLDATDPSGYTPLRAALSSAGRYFARRAPGQSTDPKMDPMQYSCQKNFAILATDGGWNTYAEINSGTPRYGPYMVDNTAVGNQDGAAARPMRDGTGTAVGSSTNSLADVAYYYYYNDLRPSGSAYCTGSMGVDVCENAIVPWQRMTTFTMSLGQSGTIKFDPSYLKQTSGDFFNINRAPSSGRRRWRAPQALRRHMWTTSGMRRSTAVGCSSTWRIRMR
jgi:type IV pilus assembly protein PilY1